MIIEAQKQEPVAIVDTDPIDLQLYPPQRQPLTQTEVVEGFCNTPHDVQFVSVFEKGVRFAEAAHGIGKGEA
jgi:hypothetical protein